MAGRNVFAIPELLEAILAELPPVDLLHMQSVCRRWRQVLVACPYFRRKMFLRAVTTLEQLQEVQGDTITVAYDHIPSRPIQFYVAEEQSKVHNDRIPISARLYLNAIKTNPMFPGNAGPVTEEDSHGGRTPPLMIFQGCNQFLSFKHEKLSYARMFITQPPCFKVGMIGYTFCSCTPDHRSKLSNPKGITIGDVLREVKKLEKHSRNG